MPSIGRCAALAALVASAVLGACSSFTAGSAPEAGDSGAAEGGGSDSMTTDGTAPDAPIGDGASFCAQFASDLPCADFDDSAAPYGNFAAKPVGVTAVLSLVGASSTDPSQSLRTYAPVNNATNGPTEATIVFTAYHPNALKFRVEADMLVEDVTADGTVIQIYGYSAGGNVEIQALTYFGTVESQPAIEQQVLDGNNVKLSSDPLTPAILPNTWVHIAVDVAPGDTTTNVTTTLTAPTQTNQFSKDFPVASLISFDIVVGSFVASASPAALSLHIDNVVVHPME